MRVIVKIKRISPLETTTDAMGQTIGVTKGPASSV